MTAVATAPTLATRPRPGDEARVVTVFANLLPDEVVAGRRLRSLQRNIVLGLAVLIVLLVGLYGFSFWQTSDARSNLSDAQTHTSSLQNQLKTYAPLLAAQAQAASINQTLSGLMTDDLSWRNLIDRLTARSHGDVVLTGVTGSVTDPNQPATGTSTTTTTTDPTQGLGLLNESGKTAVGTLTISGTAHDKRSLAAFADRLSSVRGITVPLPASVTGAQGRLEFSINALITSDALGGRFTPTTGGK